MQTKISKFREHIRLGDWVEALIHTISFGYGERIALWVARKFFDSNDCGCCRRKEWLNQLTNPNFNGECNGIKLY
jgi:hypothetical protein